VQLLHGIKCSFTTSGPAPACDHDTAVHVYRITQEAINNAIRHGQSQEITISLEADGPHHRIVIRDDGIGFDSTMERSRPGVGLHLMSYRAGIIGGTFSITSEPGGGARAECTFSTSSPAYETATP
jgi:signal transduction histidine kinase